MADDMCYFPKVPNSNGSSKKTLILLMPWKGGPENLKS